MDWRIKVWDQAGTAKTTRSPADPIESIGRLGYDAVGSCTDAEITLVGTVDIRARDTIQVQLDLDGVGTFTGVWIGIVTIGANPRTAQLQSITAVGLKQRCYELTMPERKLTGGDVAAVAQTGVTGSIARIHEAVLLPGFPNLGFTIGDRYPNRQDLGGFLDDLAATVGSFTVPAAETYSYNGKTWTAGEVVPAAQWGVNGGGIVFFARPGGAARGFNEASSRVDVVWQSIAAEQVNDETVLVYASAFNGDARAVLGSDVLAEPVATPLALRVGSGTLGADRTFALDAPLDFMTEGVDSFSGSGEVTDTAYAFDGDPATYALFGADGSGTPRGFVDAEVATTTGAIIVLDFQTSQEQFYDSLGFPRENVQITIQTATASTSLGALIYRFPPEVATRRALALPIMPFGQATGVPTRATVSFTGAESVRLYAIEMWTPDTDVAARLAEVLARPVPDDAAEIIYRGVAADRLGWWTDPVEIRPLVEITDLAGATVEGVIESASISLTADEGITTRFGIGQRYKAEDAALAVVLERLARRAVAEGGARR